jgi:hypothetical protein
MPLLHPFPFGAIRPSGWLEDQMRRDMRGFVGNLDRLVPGLIGDPIYGEGRIRPGEASKELGNLKSGDAEGDAQYQWWNSETQSNWWDGYLRHAFLLSDAEAIEATHRHVDRILATQDADGYIGIYSEELRYRFGSENGELWAKATLLRALLAYQERTGRVDVMEAVRRAVDDVMRRYPMGGSHPFATGTDFNGGVSHGLSFTDVLDRLHLHTGDSRYLSYATFLYLDYAAHWQSECDGQLRNILDPAYRLRSHGVHTYAQLRSLIVAASSPEGEALMPALETYLGRIRRATTISGGAIGDEWIHERDPDATHTGYEFCSLQELLDSYGRWMRYSGEAWTGDAIENTYFNAAWGARHPHHSGIAYLKTDNSFEMAGSRNGDAEPGRHQTRYKYSPAHQDVAVCCNPNAGRIAPYFLQHAWFREGDRTLVAALHMPLALETEVDGTSVRIENRSRYPFEHRLLYRIGTAEPVRFTLKVRVPEWADEVRCGGSWHREGGFLLIERTFRPDEELEIGFETRARCRTDSVGDRYVTHGPLLYALPIEARETQGRRYADGFGDWMYHPVERIPYGVPPDPDPEPGPDGTVRVTVVDRRTGTQERMDFVHIGSTILRQITFPQTHPNTEAS